MPEPEKGQSERDFLKVCIPQMIHDKDFEQKRAVAACYNIYRRKGTEAKSPKPERKNKEKLCKGDKCKILLAHY